MAYDFAAITGATSGIGAAFAKALPVATNLLLTGRDAAKLAEAKSALAHPGRSVETVAADLASEAGRCQFLKVAEVLPIDLLINNAGLGRFGRVVDNPAEREREMVEVNVVAVTTLTRALLPRMLERARAKGRRAGLIIIGSTASFQPTPYLATYGATKAFDLFYAEALAGELRGAPINVLALCPGGTATAFFGRAGFTNSHNWFASPERVAREGLATLGRKNLHVVGGLNRLGAFLAQRSPRAAVVRVAALMMRRRFGGSSGRD
ncbi:MAG TPA: SDR family NAD(P)-dependent oxidoreductase [Alphaproteobacteria bacterium]|nr:SDR family NAD(P)-dependent oxidoreductase [Alphaproteobacteria bacterium]